MAHANGTSTFTASLGVDKDRRPVIHVLASDGRMTEFSSTIIAVPESPRDEADTRVYGLLVNGRGELFVDRDGNPVLVPVQPLVLGRLPDPDAQLSYAEVASRAGVSLNTVRRAVQDGDLAPPRRVGDRAVRFPISDVQKWLDAKKRPQRVTVEEWMTERAKKNP